MYIQVPAKNLFLPEHESAFTWTGLVQVWLSPVSLIVVITRLICLVCKPVPQLLQAEDLKEKDFE